MNKSYTRDKSENCTLSVSKKFIDILSEYYHEFRYNFDSLSNCIFNTFISNSRNPLSESIEKNFLEKYPFLLYIDILIKNLQIIIYEFENNSFDKGYHCTLVLKRSIRNSIESFLDAYILSLDDRFEGTTTYTYYNLLLCDINNFNNAWTNYCNFIGISPEVENLRNLKYISNPIRKHIISETNYFSDYCPDSTDYGKELLNRIINTYSDSNYYVHSSIKNALQLDGILFKSINSMDFSSIEMLKKDLTKEILNLIILQLFMISYIYQELKKYIDTVDNVLDNYFELEYCKFDPCLKFEDVDVNIKQYLKNHNKNIFE